MLIKFIQQNYLMIPLSVSQMYIKDGDTAILAIWKQNWVLWDFYKPVLANLLFLTIRTCNTTKWCSFALLYYNTVSTNWKLSGLKEHKLWWLTVIPIVALKTSLENTQNIFLIKYRETNTLHDSERQKNSGIFANCSKTDQKDKEYLFSRGFY